MPDLTRCKRQMRLFTLSASLHTYTVGRSQSGLSRLGSISAHRGPGCAHPAWARALSCYQAEYRGSDGDPT